MFSINYYFCVIFFFLSLTSTYEVIAKPLYSYADIAEKTIPSVVNIRTKSYVRKSSEQDLYSFFLQGKTPSKSSTTSLGSGIILDTDGFIATNYHVIKDATTIEILFAKSKKIEQAEVVGTDSKTDLALLKIKTTLKLNPIDLGDSDTLRIGDPILAIGNPFGYSHTVTSGIISAKGRVIGTGPFDNFLQTDASIHPGNSGGPLLDIRGRAIGIATAVSEKGQGIGFAIPINMAKKIISDLKKHGKVIRPWLGVVGKNILSRDDLDTGIDPSGVYGVIIANLIVESPAHQAGLQIGDLIMGIDHDKIYDLDELQRLLSDKKPKDTARFKIYRRGKGYMNITINLGDIPKAEDLPSEKDMF